jgi:7-cyano-7-deazaguanine synthase in queuosine biosynthesis
MIVVTADAGDHVVRERCFDENRDAPRAGDYPRYAVGVDEELFARDAAARDLVRIAVAVHLADRLVRRTMRAGYRQRSFTVTIELEEPQRWSPQRALLEELAEFATQDRWRFVLTRSKAVKRTAGVAANPTAPAPEIVALFSGGLDSLCGAAYLARRGARVAFVVHTPPGREKVRDLIARTFEAFGRPPPDPVHVVAFAVRPRQQNRDGVRTYFQEPTRRSRPFFFLALAGATALALGARRVQMGENGALGLSLPMRRGHHGPRMTRQAHTFLLDGFRRVLDGVAPGPRPWSFENPYADSTKGEACAELAGASPLAAETLSCEYGGQQAKRLRRWERATGRANRERQCGLCVPCLVRRAALHRAGIRDGDDAYTFSARKTLRALERGRDPFAQLAPSKQPPLYNFVRAHALYAARYAEEIASLTVDRFAVQYLPELRMVRPPVADARRMRSIFALQQRFAAELTEFLRA